MIVKTIGIAGLGLLGRGIATACLSRGYHVVASTLGDFAEPRAYIGKALEELKASAASPWQDRFVEARDSSAFVACDFIIESIFEDLPAKLSLFDALEAVVGQTVPIASNTSALPITLLQSGRKHSGRFIGMHWAEPCHLTRFLEIIRAEQTDDATVEATLELARRLGKEPSLVKRDVEGFIVNRLGYAMYREAFHLLEMGVADVETIDRSFRNAVGLWASIAGPFRWMDLTGLPAYASVMKRLFPKLSNAVHVPPQLQALIDSGATGVSSGSGFYEYTPEEAKAWNDLLHENVRHVGELLDKHFPIEDDS